MIPLIGSSLLRPGAECKVNGRCFVWQQREIHRVHFTALCRYLTLQLSPQRPAGQKLHERKCIHIHCHCRCRLWSQPLRKLLCCKKPISFLFVFESEDIWTPWEYMADNISTKFLGGGVLGNFYLVDSKSGEKYPCLYWKWKMRHGLEYHRVMMLKFSCSFLKVENPFHVQL